MSVYLSVCPCLSLSLGQIGLCALPLEVLSAAASEFGCSIGLDVTAEGFTGHQGVGGVETDVLPVLAAGRVAEHKL